MAGFSFSGINQPNLKTPPQIKSITMRGVKKQHLPEKICVVCGLPFAWRKKWEKVWQEVKYCSEKCRRATK